MVLKKSTTSTYEGKWKPLLMKRQTPFTGGVTHKKTRLFVNVLNYLYPDTL